MSAVIDLIDETEMMLPEHAALLKDLLHHAFLYENIPEGSELSVTIMDNDSIQAVNREYRGIDKSTDVISFALNENEEIIQTEQEMPDLLGDIIISLDKAQEQAEEYGHSLKRELGFLAVHGFLHLLGYTHEQEDAEKEMFGRQESILKDYGLER
ncbi:rRNA maturation RNase YbeY [Salibacterium aidingense]|uniref:rRNA maturation RNase YbeY n=1 Tax=Salibacterium aidingense TaxID=384933 RepID=UPI003BDAAE35